MKHLVQDFDGDGEFDNYFHLKSMTDRRQRRRRPVRLRRAQRLGQLVGPGASQRREPRHLLEQARGRCATRSTSTTGTSTSRSRRPSSHERAARRPRQAADRPADLRQRRGRRLRGRHAVLPTGVDPYANCRSGLTGWPRPRPAGPTRRRQGPRRCDPRRTARSTSASTAGGSGRSGRCVTPHRVGSRRPGPVAGPACAWPQAAAPAPERPRPDHGARLRHRPPSSFDREVALGGGEGRIRVRNKRGVELGIDKSGRLVPTFAGRSDARHRRAARRRPSR